MRFDRGSGVIITFWVVGTMLLAWYARYPNPRMAEPASPVFHGEYLVIFAIFCAITFLVLRPWSYDRSWIRGLLAVLLAGYYLFGLLVSVMHSAPVHGVSIWIALLALTALLIITGVSGYGRFRYGKTRNKSLEQPGHE